MQKQESLPEYKMHKILWEFEIQTNLLILTGRQDLVSIKKRK